MFEIGARLLAETAPTVYTVPPVFAFRCGSPGSFLFPHLSSRMSATLKFGAGSGVDPFAKPKGLITELISRLQEEASSVASQNAVQPVRVRFNRVASEMAFQYTLSV